MASGIKDLGVTFTSRMLSILVTVATQSVLAWGLGADGRGEYAVCVLVPTLLMLIFMLGCDVAVQYDVASKKQTLSQGVIHITIYGLAASALAIAVGLAGVYFRVPVFTKAQPQQMYLALASIPVGFLSQALLNTLISLKEFMCSAIFAVAAGAMQLVLAVLFVFLLRWDVEGAVLSLLIGNALIIVAVLATMSRRNGLRLVRPHLGMILGMIHYGSRYYVGKLSNLANVQLGTILLALFADTKAIGLFAVASQATIRILMIPDTMSTVLIPRVADGSAGRSRLVAQASRVCFIICGAILLVLCIFATPIVAVLFSPEFLDAVPLIRIIALGVLLRAASKVFVPYILFQNRPGAASWSVLLGVLTNLGLLMLLMPLMGLAGAGWAMTAGYVVSSVTLTAMFHRFSGLGYWEIIRPRKSDWEPIANIWARMRGPKKRIALDVSADDAPPVL